MKARSSLLALLAVSGIVAISAVESKVREDVTPVQKVVELMNNMLSKGKKMKEEEQLQFAAYKQFCEDTAVEKSRRIKEAEEKIAGALAMIEKLTSDAKKLTEEIAVHDEDISTWEGDINAATNVRNMEKEDYDALHKDYTESISALGRAIEVLQDKSGNRAQAGASFLQVSSLSKMTLIPEHAKKVINVFLQQFPTVDLQTDDDAPPAAPEAFGYEFQSQGVIEMLNKLLEKFEGEKTKIEVTEREAQHAYEIVIQDLTDQLNEAKKDRKHKSEVKATKIEKKAQQEADVKTTTEVMEEDKKYLADLKATCEQKATDFESRQALRTEEIAAIEKAIEIIESGDVAGAADKHLPSLLQIKATSMAQLRANSELSSEAVTRLRLTSFLSSEAKNLKSRLLFAVAVRAEADPFVKVRKLIKELIQKLQEEAAEEAEHKGYCDAELSTNEQTRKDKSDAIETLHAEIDELEASVAKLTEDLADLNTEIKELTAAMKKATEIRQAEKSKNTQTIADAGTAQDAVAKAVVVLKEFYAKAGEATALVQEGQDQPEIFDSPYRGMGSENGGVVGMLEVIESDFARLEAETKAEEASAAAEYDSFMSESRSDVSQKELAIERKTAKKQDDEQMLLVKTGDLDGTQKELGAALEYFDKLKPSCVDSGISYDDRVARRKDEIKSLQEALEMLNSKQ